MNFITRPKSIFGILLLFFSIPLANATDYYFHPRLGKDSNSGLARKDAFRTLEKVKSLRLQEGDRILLAAGEVFEGSLEIVGFQGSAEHPLVIDSYFDNAISEFPKAKINAKGYLNGILIENSNFVNVQNLEITAEGYGTMLAIGSMRVGVMIRSANNHGVKGITLDGLKISRVFFEEKEVKRSAEEVKTANGTQRYGWGIRVINQSDNEFIEEIEILNSEISDVSHTGIKLTGSPNQNIRRVRILGNTLNKTGGPGIQMSGVKFVHVADNTVTYSGSADDSRKWGRGSGLWTWGSSMVLIEKNKFLYANGPGDSAGAHIDFNCDNIVLQYNISAYNAGGFIEVLGNNYNCAYRYNISVNDGHRVKGKDGAFQEGKIFWLSGYQGEKRPRKGPVNSYFYNNTIFVSEDLVAKIAIDNRSSGILLANNIFYIQGKTEQVSGDQYLPDDSSERKIEHVFFKNNLFLKQNTWPEQAIIQSEESRFGDPQFSNPGGLNPEDYIPFNLKLVQEGIPIRKLSDDAFGLPGGLEMETDFLGNPIQGNPGIGAIQVDPSRLEQQLKGPQRKLSNSKMTQRPIKQ
ncbi:right-handed parallel beta-helix repeat-containing protein [Algoriphagus sp. CAU 1675]|uniref:right-handed parallel beta-helix repeat-containing protein n=1 Tax=Algoriphagus sp. CAU 1675 TaxID=3032597 RepID=UPI0023D9D262|nr:right-handed parallel beta-helix repeat-containing protein [Algoriphagus sp. CAU 1675]MDF2159020.1 right-handed parallel beta-helix repeat-containing protein [Algoriphagus sp. CAU 1675]